MSEVFVVHIIVPRYPFLQDHVKEHVSGRKRIKESYHPFLPSQFAHLVRLKTMTVLMPERYASIPKCHGKYLT